MTQSPSQDIGVAHAAGARLHLACEIAGIDVRTLQRWRAHEGLAVGDGRPQAVRPPRGHALSDVERAELVRVANEPRFAAVPPARIVPMLADDGVYLASESTFFGQHRLHPAPAKRHGHAGAALGRGGRRGAQLRRCVTRAVMPMPDQRHPSAKLRSP